MEQQPSQVPSGSTCWTSAVNVCSLVYKITISLLLFSLPGEFGKSGLYAESQHSSPPSLSLLR